jgi:lambda family phage tail tape measure protein
VAQDSVQLRITAVDQTKAAFDSIKRGLTGLTDAARSVNGVFAALGVAASAAGFTALVKSSIDAADALNKLSQRVGITVESLSTLVPAAKISGLSAEEFEVGLKKLATTMFEAATGSADAARRFEALGVAIRDQDGALRATDQVLLDLADRFKAMPDGATKSALAVDLFGRSGTRLIPLLNQGRDGIKALTDEMAALGVQISSETAAQAEAFNDTLEKLKRATTSIGNQIIASLLPAMNEMANSMVESAKQGGTLRAVLDGILLALKVLALGAATVGKAFVALGEAIGAGFAAAVEALKGNASTAKAILADLKNNLVKRLDELAEFRDSLFNPKPTEAKKPSIQADPELLRALNKNAGDISKAQLAAARDRAEAELAIIKDGLQRQKAALDAALEDRLVSIRDYYQRKNEIEQREITAEIARTSALLAEQQRIAQSGKTEADRIRARGEVARLEAELIVLNNRRADVEQTNARASAKAERELADALAEAKLRLAEITGTATDADRRAAVERSFRDLRARLLAEGDVGGVSIVDRLIDVEAAQRNLQALEDAWRRALETMRQAEQSINIQQAQGLITTSEAQRRIAAAHQEASVALDELLPKMEAAAQAIGPDAVARVQAWKNELASVKNVIDPVVATINTQMQDAFESMFTAIGTGAKSAKEAFADFGRSVLATLNRIAANKLAEQLLGMAFGPGGAGGFFKGIFGFARGGPVPGSGDRDIVPALLTPGEYVIRRDAVRRIGVAMLDAINGLRVPPAVLGGRLAFAAGGLVPAAAQAAAPTVNQAVRIVNVVDPAMAADYLNSPQGEKTVLNVLSRNAQAVRQIFATA